MKLPYTHLTLDECRELFRLHSPDPNQVLSQRLNRHPSSLLRNQTKLFMMRTIHSSCSPDRPWPASALGQAGSQSLARIWLTA